MDVRVVGAGIGALATVAFVGWWIRQVVHALGPDASRIAAIYRNDLGGFIDHEWLWGIHADREVVGRLGRGLDLGPGAVPSRRFWRMPPHYWPRAMPSGGVALQSAEFRAEERGPDGEHHFLVHDPSRDQAFVWVKSNF